MDKNFDYYHYFKEDLEYLKSHELSLDEISHLIELGFPIPLPCTFNGFYLKPVVFRFDCANDLIGVCWNIIPTQSLYSFFFKDLTSACKFAKTYSNNHKMDFWSNKWFKLFSFKVISSTLSPLCCFSPDEKL